MQFFEILKTSAPKSSHRIFQNLPPLSKIVQRSGPGLTEWKAQSFRIFSRAGAVSFDDVESAKIWNIPKYPTPTKNVRKCSSSVSIFGRLLPPFQHLTECKAQTSFENSRNSPQPPKGGGDFPKKIEIFRKSLSGLDKVETAKSSKIFGTKWKPPSLRKFSEMWGAKILKTFSKIFENPLSGLDEVETAKLSKIFGNPPPPRRGGKILEDSGWRFSKQPPPTLDSHVEYTSLVFVVTWVQLQCQTLVLPAGNDSRQSECQILAFLLWDECFFRRLRGSTERQGSSPTITPITQVFLNPLFGESVICTPDPMTFVASVVAWFQLIQHSTPCL